MDINPTGARRPETRHFIALACVAMLGCEAVLGLNGLSEVGDGGVTPGQDATVGQDATSEAEASIGPDGADDSRAPVASSTGIDAGPGDGATDGGDGGPYWTFSDGFELGNLSRWSAVSMSTGGTLSVVDSGAFDGSYALHATGKPDATAYESVVTTWTTALTRAPPVQAGTVAVRLHLRASALDFTTIELLVGQGGGSPVWSAQAGLKNPAMTGGTWFWQAFLVDPANPTATYKTASVGAALDTNYHCVELVLNVSPNQTTGRFSIFLDGQAAPWVTLAADTTSDAGWDSVLVGLPFASGTGGASDVLVDDVTVSLYSDLSPTAHIGCP